MIHVASILRAFFQGKGYVLMMTKTGWGYILGHIFTKLIWSPWLQSRLKTQLEKVSPFFGIVSESDELAKNPVYVSF
jgi:hypothetical protein